MPRTIGPLYDCDLAGGEVIQATDDVNFLPGVALLDHRRRVLEACHLSSDVLGARVVEQMGGPRLLSDHHSWFDCSDELRQMTRKHGSGLQHLDCGIDRAASCVAKHHDERNP